VCRGVRLVRSRAVLFSAATMVLRVSLLVLLSLALLSCAVADDIKVDDPDVTVLTDANFEAFIQDELTLVEFYAPWSVAGAGNGIAPRQSGNSDLRDTTTMLTCSLFVCSLLQVRSLQESRSRIRYRRDVAQGGRCEAR
jgi:hypothetical protein